MFNDLFGSKDLLKLVSGELKDDKGDLIRVPNGFLKKLQGIYFLKIKSTLNLRLKSLQSTAKIL